ncbi:hypothetical protein BT69DRAFT_1336248 [Atractiella rhizophila]|nr:hypothetical protein BT69DRAFT_1336248 [Atractiella rhizophila]
MANRHSAYAHNVIALDRIPQSQVIAAVSKHAGTLDTFTFRREQAEPIASGDTPLLLEVQEQLASTLVFSASFYRSDGLVVVKPLRKKYVIHELRILKRLRSLAGVSIPAFFGAFINTTGKNGVTVIQHTGPSLRKCGIDFSDLGLKEKVYAILLQIHALGVVHNDVHEGNVTMDEQGNVYLIDFMFSRMHKCPGESKCEELIDVRKKLRIQL